MPQRGRRRVQENENTQSGEGAEVRESQRHHAGRPRNGRIRQTKVGAQGSAGKRGGARGTKRSAGNKGSAGKRGEQGEALAEALKLWIIKTWRRWATGDGRIVVARLGGRGIRVFGARKATAPSQYKVVRLVRQPVSRLGFRAQETHAASRVLHR